MEGLLNKWVTRQILNGVLSLLPDQAKLFFAVEDRTAGEFERGAWFTKLVATLARKNQTAEQLIAQAVGDSVANPYQRVRGKRKRAAKAA